MNKVKKFFNEVKVFFIKVFKKLNFILNEKKILREQLKVANTTIEELLSKTEKFVDVIYDKLKEGEENE